jgi:hypothetical protein
MLDRFDDRTLEIATVVVVVVIALVILCYLAIFINPWVPFNPFPPATPTPEQGQALATMPATWTPTATATQTETPTPTATWTPTPTPTDTPLPTATNTATPTATNTRKPPTNTPRPKPPKPTATPTPWPYYYTISEAGPDCAATWVWGYVVGTDGLAEPNVQVRVGNDQGWRADTWTDVNGRYEFKFADGAQAGMWFVRVFKGGQARSMQYWFKSSAGCEGPYNLQQFHIDWRRR